MKIERLDFYRSKLAEIEGKEDSFVIFTDTVTKKFIQFASGKKGGFYANVPAKKLTEKEINKLDKLLGLEMKVHLESSVIEKVTEIPGIGWVKAFTLYEHLKQYPGDFEGITRASKDDLQKLPGIEEKMAKKIVSFIPELKKHILEMRSKTIAEKDYTFEKECTLEEAADLTRRFFEEVCNLPENHDISVELNLGEEKCALCGKTIKESVAKFPEISIDKARELGISDESIQKKIDDEIRFAVEETPEDELDEEAIKKIVHERGTIFTAVCSNCSSSHNLKG